jgi:hypothetical protein
MNRVLRFVLVALCLLLIGGGIAGYFYIKTLGSRSKARIIRALDDRFNADVSIQSINISILPHPAVTVEGLSVRHRNWPSRHPLFSARRFTARFGFLTLFTRRDLVELVKLEGLAVYLPPRGGPNGVSLMKPRYSNANAPHRKPLHFLIKTIVADSTLLVIEPKQEDKEPLRFDIAKLTLTSTGPGRELAFKAQLTNPKPPGLIDTTGRFGPWQTDDPRSTPVSGQYTFEHADLGVFKGIRGVLSSTGKYSGVLERIDVQGATSTPDFALKRGGDPMPLNTTFHSIVDGTDGDTILENVNANLGNSEFLCQGSVTHLPGSEGKTISLTATTKQARMEDILKLVLGSAKAMIKGDVDFRSKILIPQGKEPVIDKLQLDGRFNLASAIFTSPKVEQTLTTLSLRARGVDKKQEQENGYKPKNVGSNLNGVFKLKNGVSHFSRCFFSVPGATVNLSGSFNLRTDGIDMKGIFRMEATLSDTQSGFKSLLLKTLDPFFKKNGAGFQIPITITGTRDKPLIGARVFHHEFTIH